MVVNGNQNKNAYWGTRVLNKILYLIVISDVVVKLIIVILTAIMVITKITIKKPVNGHV